MSVDSGTNLLDICPFVDADSIKRDSRLVLPIGIDFLDSIQLTKARLAPCTEEAHDNGLTWLEERGGGDGLAIEISQGDLRKILGIAQRGQQEGHETQ